MHQVELPPGSPVGPLSDTDMVVLGLITTPAAPLVSVNTQCSGARHGAASTGCFPLAPRKCCVEKMAAGKCRAESAAEINLSFVDTPGLQWSGRTWGRSCSSGAAGWDAPGRLAKAPVWLQDEPGTPCAYSHVDTGHPDTVTAVTDPFTVPVRALQALLAGMDEVFHFPAVCVFSQCFKLPRKAHRHSPCSGISLLSVLHGLCHLTPCASPQDSPDHHHQLLPGEAPGE